MWFYAPSDELFTVQKGISLLLHEKGKQGLRVANLALQAQVRRRDLQRFDLQAASNLPRDVLPFSCSIWIYFDLISSQPHHIIRHKPSQSLAFSVLFPHFALR